MNSEGLLEAEPTENPRDVARARRQLFRPRERVQRQMDRMERLARSDLSDHLSPATPRLSPTTATRTRRPSHSPERSSTVEGRSPRAWAIRKRRKLDDGSADDGNIIPSYGLEGTLVAGPLKMKVVENDGNHESLTAQEEAAKFKLHVPTNTDSYRSRRNRCNVLMKHTGGWPFSLSKIVIKVPKHDLDVVPLQGMVFIAMTDDKLMEKTLTYDQYFPASYQRHHPRGYDSYRPSQDFIRSHRPPFRSAPRPRRLSDPPADQWYNIIRSINEPVEVAQVPGFDVTIDHTPEADSTDDNTFPHSPQPWNDIDVDIARRYADRYRPSHSTASMRERYSAYIQSNGPSVLSPLPSDSESEDTELYRGILQNTRELDEARERQLHNLDQARLRRERSDSDPTYLYEDPTSPVRRLISTGSFFQRASSTQSPDISTTKRLPGPQEMLQGKSVNSQSETSSNEIMPHAKFCISRESGGIVTIHFEPNV